MAQDNLRDDDSIQHGIDDNAQDDGKTALGLGAVGGGTVGAIAGSALGPLGTLVGAAIGGTIGSLASGAAVDAVDAVDNDNTVSGIGDGVHHKGDLTRDSNDLSTDYSTVGTGGTSYTSGTGSTPYAGTSAGGHNVVTGDEAETDAGKGGLATGAVVGGLLGTAVAGPVGAVVGGTLGSLAGGVAGDASEVADDDINTRGTAGTGYGTTMNTNSTNTNPMGGYYGNYEGRDITRDEYDRLPESDRLKVRLLEEHLNVTKEERQVGEVEVTKRVVEEQVQVPVTLEREEIVIHRHAATGSTSATGESIGAGRNHRGSGARRVRSGDQRCARF
jgi:outer membrane lipoprotein SlyB